MKPFAISSKDKTLLKEAVRMKGLPEDLQKAICDEIDAQQVPSSGTRHRVNLVRTRFDGKIFLVDVVESIAVF